MTPAKTQGSFEELLLTDLLEVHEAARSAARLRRTKPPRRHVGRHVPTLAAFAISDPESVRSTGRAHRTVDAKRRLRLRAAIGVAMIAAAVAVVALVSARSTTGPTEVTAGAVGTTAPTTQSAGSQAPLTAERVLAKALPLMESRLGISFPADAIAKAKADEAAAEAHDLKSIPDVELRPTDGSQLGTGGQRGPVRYGNEVSVGVTVYPSDGTGILTGPEVAPGAKELSVGSGSGGCEVWLRDNADPRDAGVIRAVAVMCPRGMLLVAAASPTRGGAIDPAVIASLAASAFI